jgi:peptide chain release factor 1
VTDHRIELTMYNLPTFIEGDIDDMIEALRNNDLQEKLSSVTI